MHSLYKAEKISERHRHRFEVNNKYREILTENGLCLSGTSPNSMLVEAVELPESRSVLYRSTVSP